MIRKLLCIACAALLFTACKINDGKFMVSGTIKGAPNDTLYLEKLSYNSAVSKPVDSVKLDKGGNYKLSGVDTQQNLYILGFKNNPAVILVNDSKNIHINSDLNGFHYPDISGSDATGKLYTLIKNLFQKDSVLSFTYYQLDSLQKSGSTDSADIKPLQQQYTTQLSALTDVLTSFIHQSNDPAAICFAIDKAKGTMPPDQLIALINDASKRFPKHDGITAFKNAVAQATSQQQSDDNGAAALINAPAPDLTMQDVNGKKVSISSFKGKYLLVDFWASWCGPCRQENPNVVAAFNKFRNKNFTILGVSLDENKQDWLAAIKHDNLAWTQMSDLKQWESAAVSTYHFNGIPFNVLIDPQGKIIAESLRGDMLEQKLSEVLQ